MVRALYRILLSIGASAILIGLLIGLGGARAGGVSSGEILTGVRGALPLFVGVYILCQFFQTFFRAWRARILLTASMENGKPPSLWHISLVTFVRGACADMLPARLGELSYVAMLNKGCAVPASDCLSSLSIGLVFDFIALLVVLVVAIPAASQGMSLLGASIVLALVCFIGISGLFTILPAIAKFLKNKKEWGLLNKRPFSAIATLVISTADSVGATRQKGIAVKVVLLSIAIRLAKYIGLYCLFVAVTRPQWPQLSEAGIFSALIAIIAAEGAASLPVPTFLSFGTYEAGGLAALTALGFPALDSVSAMLSMHILSQIIDYSCGGVAFLLFTWRKRKTTEENNGKKVPLWYKLLYLAIAIAFLGGSTLFALYQYRASIKRGRITAPPRGEAVKIDAASASARAEILERLNGKIAWSSNRDGLHNIWLFDKGSDKPRRVTRSPFTDTYPKFSPDGSKIAFSRSQQPWVSQRNASLWDTYVIDIATGNETLIATNACFATWTPDGKSLVFMAEGGYSLEKVDLANPAKTRQKLLVDVPDGTLLTAPDVRESDPWITITLRGTRRSTSHIYRNGKVVNIAKGCQMIWNPAEPKSSLWVEGPGEMKNSFYILDAAGQKSLLFDAKAPYGHEYFPRLSQNGKWLVYGASTGGHEQDSEDYEIFLLNLEASPYTPIRLTFHTSNDSWPDIWQK